MDDENMLRTRLEVDDRQIRGLQKKISSWLSSLPIDTNESTQNIYESLLLQLTSYQTNVERYPILVHANDTDINNYEHMGEETAREVVATAEQISSLKDELKEAQKVRNNKLEYDKVAREIMKLQTRDEYQQSIMELKADIDMLKREKANKEQAFESRKVNFAELIKTVKDLQRTVEEERAKGHEMQKKLMDMDRGYQSSDDEASVNSDSQGHTPEDHHNANGGSHRFQERNNEDDDGDEEGMVADEDVIVNGVH
ncbi:Tho complex subunit 7-domain-containing protein [Zychaea mexicana]|uniref:Tho complex subunit 7-domain-containing protein n=1 Tax=Zychaea mexicana TaxID=64656 RepID=UPI0022FEF1C8|nr:Tho complex subunit 7-domain-containing protein [Zychaea mexicana]KAI9496014.1 Tho complex subunit 7-domain-containing protein [Zychaea mexicana]